MGQGAPPSTVPNSAPIRVVSRLQRPDGRHPAAAGATATAMIRSEAIDTPTTSEGYTTTASAARKVAADTNAA